ncbi:hypothetical protein UFOVP80_22 [uncultured Caudovirales phage]|jgi:hypothetical protein|uniref:Uncharacterized protein n=1 Tax=uncultured Caudovirales phage TaxID=2100421 RepID=A0A6J5KZY4_9CAUD|nr:hypothetical protein UFOVP80_22 [uncultured Caudovirales phage]
MKKEKEIKEQVEMVKEVAAIQSEMSSLTTDKISETAPEAKDEYDVSEVKKKAEKENAIFIEPKIRMQAFGKLKPDWKKKRDYDWEYVKGSFQPEIVNGRPSMEPRKFWHCKWPGDQDCFWDIPVDRPVYVPRMIAKLLSGEKEDDTGIEAMKFHTFDYMERPTPYWKPDQFTHQFQPTGTNYRGRFVQIGAY